MKKYEKMLAINRTASREKIERAKNEIAKMLKNDTEVSVCELVKRTGLSRGFFIKMKKSMKLWSEQEICREERPFTNHKRWF